MVDFEGDYVGGNSGLTDAEERIVDQFLKTDGTRMRSLADIIIEKIREKGDIATSGSSAGEPALIPTKVVEVFSAVGKMLQHYKSGKLPKAIKMLPHLKNWEEILWLKRPDEWSPSATFACTRIFASVLNEKMAQRFYNMVLLEKCRDDIRRNRKLNYHLYMALKKALFKVIGRNTFYMDVRNHAFVNIFQPAAFYKGFLLPLVQTQTCTLREAVIIGSVLAKVVKMIAAHCKSTLNYEFVLVFQRRYLFPVFTQLLLS